MVIKIDLKKKPHGGSKSCAHIAAGRSGYFCLGTTRGSEETTVFFFLELTSRHDKVKTLVECQPRRCKETKVYEPQFRGRLKGEPYLIRDPADKHIRNIKKFNICVLSSFSHQVILLIFV